MSKSLECRAILMAKRMFSGVKTKTKHIRYTIEHRRAFRLIEKKLFGRVSIRGYLHDLDKVFLYLFLSKESASKLHRKFARHHINRARTKRDFEEMVVDWECARYTKRDKPLNAYETLYAYYPQLETTILPILKELNIDKIQLPGGK